MESPFIFPNKSQALSVSLNNHEANHSFVHPWWKDPQSTQGEKFPPPHAQHQELGQKKLEANLTPEPQELFEGRTIILLCSIAFLILIIIFLIIWVKQMNNAQVSNIMMI